MNIIYSAKHHFEGDELSRHEVRKITDDLRVDHQVWNVYGDDVFGNLHTRQQYSQERDIDVVVSDLYEQIDGRVQHLGDAALVLLGRNGEGLILPQNVYRVDGWTDLPGVIEHISSTASTGVAADDAA